MAEEWEASDFGRRGYYISDDPSDKGKGELENAKRIAVIVTIDGKKYASLQAREPGMIAIVSRPDEEGIRIEVVSPEGVRFTDVMTPEGIREQETEPWQKEALGFDRGV